MKSTLFAVLFILAIGLTACKKEKLVIDGEKVVIDGEKAFYQKGFVLSNPIMGGWSLILRKDSSADIVPAGDISYRGTYEIKGSSLKVTTDQAGDFDFEIISEREIKEKKYGTILILK